MFNWEVSLPVLALPHVCAYPITGPGFPILYFVVVFVSNGLRCDMVVIYVDVGKIVFLNLCGEA